MKIRLKLEMIEFTSLQASQCNGVTVSWIDTDNVHWTKLVKIRPELEMIKKTSQRNGLNPHRHIIPYVIDVRGLN